MTINRKGFVKQVVTPWNASEKNSHQQLDDCIAEECAVALVYNGISHAVMMMTPTDLREFAIGFSFSEGIIDSIEDIYDFKIAEHENGLELNIHISSSCFVRLKKRRRNLQGNSGCGLCGVESLNALTLCPNSVVTSESVISHKSIDQAASRFLSYQPLQSVTGATHAAAWCNDQGEIQLVSEDIGRHNALDKLIGKFVANQVYCNHGFVLISSRASYEIVTKAVKANIAVVAAVSAPTSLAISVAEKAQLTLIGFSRTGRHVVYTQAQRINNN